MPDILLNLFKIFDQEKITYCLLRDGDRLDLLARGGELDLLVQPAQFEQLCRLLARQGFVRLPDWGYAPHHFFVAYDQAQDSWFKLDVVTEIAYGQPLHVLHTELAQHCLATRQRRGETYLPAPECELIALLLHCVLDKATITPIRGERLQALRHAVVDEQRLAALLAEYWQPGAHWLQLAGYIEQGDWGALLAERSALLQRLQQRDRFGVAYRQITKRLSRKLNGWLTARRPESLSVAVLAPDGAGKSTLVDGLKKSFYFPVRTIYMGLYQKGRKRLRIPGLAGRLLMQWERYLRGRLHQLRRRLVIFDRYSYDALLPSRQQNDALKQWRRWLLAYSCPAPDLVIFLDAPGELLYARKGEHSAAILEQQRQGYLALRAHVPQMVVVDAARDPGEVRREVTALIWRSYLERQIGSKPQFPSRFATTKPENHPA